MEQRAGHLHHLGGAAVLLPRRCVINLLDTPGHADFSEDTYRVLTAVDCAVMLLDAAKGLEPQTLKLFEVCRHRGIPVITFVNKWDRPGREPLELLDEIERTHRAQTHPADLAGRDRRRLQGVLDRRTGNFTRFTRTAGRCHRRPRGAPRRRAGRRAAGADWDDAREERGLLDADRRRLRPGLLPAGEVDAGAVHLRGTDNFGVRQLWTR